MLYLYKELLKVHKKQKHTLIFLNIGHYNLRKYHYLSPTGNGILFTDTKSKHMFKSKKASPVIGTKNSVPAEDTSASLSNNIAHGTHIEGKFITSEDVRLDGMLKGEILCHKKLVMGENGQIDGDAVCEDSSIKGKIIGTLKVKGLLHLLATARLEGKIMAKKMVVDEGASYSGECLIGEKHVK